MDSSVNFKRYAYRLVYCHDNTEEECTSNKQAVLLQSDGQPWKGDNTGQLHCVSVLVSDPVRSYNICC
ncbi:unnamed protein product [Linum trigynum]|uniref:Uncharacterized protein n=1 Tax=Linum trigynum TaxID=586398 RepID=A0AAV2GIB9_9ROSI